MKVLKLFLVVLTAVTSCQAFGGVHQSHYSKPGLLVGPQSLGRVQRRRHFVHQSSQGEVEWKGSVYSSKVPKKRHSNSMSTTVTVDLKHCGAIEIEQQKMRNNRTGVALWSAAYSMADYIDERCGSNEWNSENLTCLELGAGLGLPSIVAAKHGFDCWATEIDETVLPLLKKNVQTNFDCDDSVHNNGVRVHTLDWNDDIDQHPPDLVDTDIIVASELIYKDTKPYWSTLISFLRRLRSRRRSKNNFSQKEGKLSYFDETPTHGDPLVLLGYTLRSRNLAIKEAREFFAMLRQNGFEVCPVPHNLVPNSENRVLTTLFELRWT
mmetsp:Transcript_10954/g.16136  ORF Transcript_10954/g.16136 Transcript_10954/m.16136 type:complete len:323 (+) Transcript_10954:30-998(+)